MRRYLSSTLSKAFTRAQATAAKAAEPAKKAESAAPAEKSFFKATELIGYVHSIDGTIATVVVFLTWVYVSAVIALYGVEVTAAYARLRKRLPQEAPAAPVREE